MAYGIDDLWRVWNDLERKEEDLKWSGHQPGFGQQFNSMGRPANASSHFNMGWANEHMGRVSRLRKALNDSGPMTRGMLARQLSGIDLSTIWHILVSACQDIALYYCGSVATGAFIGGLGGAFFGGVGAVPGAAAGAAAGGYVGGWVLAMLGLQSLVGDLAQAIPEALRCYERGFLEAWGPTRHDHQHSFGASSRGVPSAAAFDLANGHVIMISAILAALVAYLTRGKGDKATLLKEISQSSRLGPRVARWVEENEDKLRQHPALQSRGHGALPRDEPPPPKRGREPTKEQERDTVGDSVRNPKTARDAGADYGENSVTAGNRSELFKSINSISEVPTVYSSDSRFVSLASDPAHGGAVTQGGLREAMAGLEAERQGLVAAPISRGPARIEFYDGNGVPYDVKTPPSVSGVKFDPVQVGRSINKQLNSSFPNAITGVNEPVRVILDSTYLNSVDHAALWIRLNNNVDSSLLKNITEITTRHK